MVPTTIFVSFTFVSPIHLLLTTCLCSFVRSFVAGTCSLRVFLGSEYFLLRVFLGSEYFSLRVLVRCGRCGWSLFGIPRASVAFATCNVQRATCNGLQSLQHYIHCHHGTPSEQSLKALALLLLLEEAGLWSTGEAASERGSSLIVLGVVYEVVSVAVKYQLIIIVPLPS